MADRDTLVTVHDGGGSMVEAASPRAAYGPFTADEANQIVNYANRLLGQHSDEHIRHECWAQAIQFKMAPTVQAMPDGTPVPNTAVDIGAMLNAALDSED